MRIGCFQACSCLSACYESTKQTLCLTITKLDEIRKDTEAFQKLCILALATLRSINHHCRTHYFPHLIEVLDTAPAFDFYGFCRLPRLFLYPYTAQRLDEYALLDQLEVILCQNWHLDLPDDKQQNSDSPVCGFIKMQLTAFLKKMLEKEIEFRTAEEVKNALQAYLVATLEANPQQRKLGFDPYSISLQDLKIELKKDSWIEKIIKYTFVGVDIICIPDFLQGWGLVNLASYTQKIGQLPIFGWVARYSLDEWVWRSLGVGHFLNFFNATYSLWKGGLTAGEAKDAKWLRAASLAECLYCLSVIRKTGSGWTNGLAIIAKSLGLMAFLAASEPIFFNEVKGVR